MNGLKERLRAISDDTAGLTGEAADEIERLLALLRRHDEVWRLLHGREYTGALRDDTRAALGGETVEMSV